MTREFTAIYKKSGKWYLAWIEEISGVNTQGKTLKEVYENSALALFNTIYDKKIKNKKKFKISIKGHDLESLLYNFLEEMLVLIDSKNFLPAKIKKLLK